MSITSAESRELNTLELIQSRGGQLTTEQSVRLTELRAKRANTARPSVSSVGAAPVSANRPAMPTPPYHNRAYLGDAPANPTQQQIRELSERTDRLSGAWYSKRNGEPDTLVFHQDAWPRPSVEELIRYFNKNWLPRSDQEPYYKSYNMLLAKEPTDGKNTHLFVSLDNDTWHALDKSNQSISVSFQVSEKGEDLTPSQLDAARQWTRYICSQYPSIKYVTTHGQVDPGRRSDPNSKNFNLQEFIDICQSVAGEERQITDCKPGSPCHSRVRNRGTTAGLRGASLGRPPINYPTRTINTAAIASSTAKQIPVLTGVADLRSFHPNVQYELTRRRLSQTGMDSYMPFVKLTALMEVTGSNLAVSTDKVWCPSLGIHGEMSTQFDDVYSPRNNRNLVGYGIKCVDNNCNTERVLVDEASSLIDPLEVPPPGITSITSERNLMGGYAVRGGLFRGTIKIVANSVGQLNTLIKYFLRPSTNVVLEMGMLSSHENTPEDVAPEYPTEGIIPFNWKRPKDEVVKELTEAHTLPESRTHFIQKYVYNNFGKYEIFICYVANFKIKYTKGAYEIELQVHSVQQMELNTRHTGIRATCETSIDNSCKAIDVAEYFDDKYAWKENSFNTLLANASNPKTDIGKEWSNHIAQIKRYSPDVQNSTMPDASGAPNGPGSGYYISWRFFIQKVLHDRQYGLISVLQLQGNRTAGEGVSEEELREGDEQLAYPLLHAQLPSPISGPVEAGKPLPDDRTARSYVLTDSNPENNVLRQTSNSNKLTAYEVGYHPRLRSTNPGVMLIYNPEAQKQADQKLKATIAKELSDQGIDISTNDEITNFVEKGEVPPFTNVSGHNSQPGTAFLTNGVWLNTNAIKNAFAQSTSVSTAITSLLTQMNNATEGYWNLQVITNDVNSGESQGMHIIDAQSKFGSTPSLAPTGTDTQQREGVLPRLGNEYDVGRAKNFSILEAYSKGVSLGNNNAIGPSGTIPNIGYLYMFNRRYQRYNDTDAGTEVLDINIEYDLPTSLMVQAIIGSGGAAERGVMRVLDVDELNRLRLIKTQLRCPPAANAVKGVKGGKPPCKYDLPTDYSDPQPSSAAGTPTTGRPARAPGEGAPAESDEPPAAVTAAATNATNLNENFINSINNFGHLGTALNLIELNPAEMMEALNTAKGKDDVLTAGKRLSRNVVHPFNSSNLTKTLVDITLPGIAGIQLWQTFAVDRVPSLLKKGTYVVTKLNHDFSLDRGWTTKLQGRFRALDDNELLNIGYNQAELNAGL